MRDFVALCFEPRRQRREEVIEYARRGSRRGSEVLSDSAFDRVFRFGPECLLVGRVPDAAVEQQLPEPRNRVECAPSGELLRVPVPPRIVGGGVIALAIRQRLDELDRKSVV